MVRFTFRMWSNGNKTQLADVLTAFLDNNWLWSVLDFEGIGQAPFGMRWDEFEEQMRAHPIGVTLSWSELKQFASRIEDVNEFLAVAVTSIDELDGTKLSRNDFSGCKAMLEAFDSTRWTVELDDAQAFRSELFASQALDHNDVG